MHVSRPLTLPESHAWSFAVFFDKNHAGGLKGGADGGFVRRGCSKQIITRLGPTNRSDAYLGIAGKILGAPTDEGSCGP